jgi:hypothetical protein
MKTILILLGNTPAYEMINSPRAQSGTTRKPVVATTVPIAKVDALTTDIRIRVLILDRFDLCSSSTDTMVPAINSVPNVAKITSRLNTMAMAKSVIMKHPMITP